MSDREQLATLPDTAALVKEATARRGGGELMPIAASEAPITPERFLSLATKVCTCSSTQTAMLLARLLREEISARFASSSKCFDFGVVQLCAVTIFAVDYASGSAPRGVR